GAIAAVNAGLLDVLHNRSNHGSLAVTDAIDVHFHRVFETAVDQDGAGSAHILCAWLRILRSFLQRRARQNDRYCVRHARATQINRGSNVAPQITLVINQLHAAATEDERWPNENWIANADGDRDRWVHADSGAVRSRARTTFVE